MSAESLTAELAWQEVVALHEFFEAWLRADGGATEFAVCERALAPDFRMVAPNGEGQDRDTVIKQIRRARKTFSSDFRITVLDPSAIWTAEDAVLLEYTEQQYRDGRSTRRRSTALFLASPSAPRRVEWRHLHETWMETAEEASTRGPVRTGEDSDEQA